MVFVFRNVLFEKFMDAVINFFQFRVGQPGDQGLHERVFGKFLQIEHDGLFVGFSVHAKGAQPLIGLDEVVGIFFHEVSWFQHLFKM